MLSQQAARKSLMGTLIDLYKSDLAFRGMTDFAVIGFVTMIFLHPPSNLDWSWKRHEGGSTTAPIHSLGDKSEPSKAIGTSIPIPFAVALKNAKLGDSFVLDFDQSAFRTSSPDDQRRLAAARTSIALGEADRAKADLQGADEKDPNVALLRGAAEAIRLNEDGRRAAEPLWRQAVDGGAIQAKALLGQLLGGGLSGVSANPAEALQLIQAGVEAGDRQAMRIAGIAYLSGELGMLDPPRAAELLKRSADAGDAMAMGLYARVLADGLGVAAPDPSEAAKYLEKAANAGLTTAQYTLGQWQLEQFNKGLRPDPKEGIAWVERAYDKGRALWALNVLAGFYEQAPKGWKNIPLAANYVRRCSGFAYCQLNTGYAWKAGYFGKVDLVAARAHSAIGVSNYPPASGMLDEIDAKLTPEQRAEAAALEQKIRAGLKPSPDELHIQYPDLPPVPPLEAIWPSIPELPLTEKPDADQKTTNTSPDIDALRKRINRHMQEKDYDSALADLTDIIRQGNAGWDDYYQRGLAHEGKGQTELALEDYNRAISRNPTAANVYFSRAYLRVAKNDEAGALEDVTTAIAREPSAPIYYLGRGHIYFGKGDYRPAIADYDKFIELSQSAPPEEKLMGYLARGKTKVQIALEEGDTCQSMIPPPPSCSPATKFEAAVKDLEQVLAINPNEGEANFFVGLIADRTGNKRKAIDFYTYALKADPDNTRAYNNRGVLYADMGQRDLAMSDYNEAIRSDPKNVMAWANRGILYSNYRNRKQAIADLRQALAIEPSNEFARKSLRKLGVRQ
jgi:tetratricopeptide (TPR) repeat protein